MSDGAAAQRLVDALSERAARETGGRAKLVSVAIEILAPGSVDTVAVHIDRQTRTLLFMRADGMAGGARNATASSVHRIPE